MLLALFIIEDFNGHNPLWGRDVLDQEENIVRDLIDDYSLSIFTILAFDHL